MVIKLRRPYPSEGLDLEETPKQLEPEKPVAPNKHTTIRITTELQKLLIEIGHKGQSYDEIIREQLIKRKSHGSK